MSVVRKTALGSINISLIGAAECGGKAVECASHWRFGRSATVSKGSVAAGCDGGSVGNILRRRQVRACCGLALPQPRSKRSAPCWPTATRLSRPAKRWPTTEAYAGLPCEGETTLKELWRRRGGMDATQFRVDEFVGTISQGSSVRPCGSHLATLG